MRSLAALLLLTPVMPAGTDPAPVACSIVRLGEPAPSVPAVDRHRGQRDIVVLIGAAAGETAPPPEGFDTVVVAVPGGSEATRGYVRPDCAVRTFFLIDKDGIVRRAGEIPPGAPAGAAIADALDAQVRGRAGFKLACARCHGADGISGDYPNIKRLAGIGNRMSGAGILKRLNPLEIQPDQISLRSHIFTRRDLDALVAFVAGL